MNEKTTPIGRMADLLAEMTERAMEAERQRDAAKEDAENWYQHYQNKDEKLADMKAVLDARIAENEVLRAKIADMQHAGNCNTGGTDNAQ